ncbi:hypothetical protein T10_7458 [Trichinella papuae]|uniref:Uncharacterized protein n=1 Tax=Trichinella papuae TaxID=268474 RepID=A0A0V1MT23_9BILA|nr:hypothetical protein T10_7458 [Trichinella papuae]
MYSGVAGIRCYLDVILILRGCELLLKAHHIAAKNNRVRMVSDKLKTEILFHQRERCDDKTISSIAVSFFCGSNAWNRDALSPLEP